MTPDEYREEALRTYGGSTRFDALCIGALGLAGETGEVVDMVKKTLFQAHLLDRAKMVDEMGDVLWYFTLLAQATGTTLEEIMEHNIEKLRKRYPEGFDPERSKNRTE